MRIPLLRLTVVAAQISAAYITLRTTAHDAAGGSIAETITRAYATGG